MLRDESITEISDGRFYGPNDLVRVDTADCSGCSLCCHGMEDTLLLEPPDIYRFQKELGLSFDRLLEGPAQLGIADGLILPHLRMKEGEACYFLNENGRCSIHPARPAYCRMFPLGRYYENGDFRYFLQFFPDQNSSRVMHLLCFSQSFHRGGPGCVGKEPLH